MKKYLGCAIRPLAYARGEPLLTLRQAQGEDYTNILMLSLSKHEDAS